MARSAGRTWGHHEQRPQPRIQPCGCGEADQRLLLELRAGERGPLLFISGQVALDPEGRIVGKSDVRAQTVQVLENIRMILRANGADMEDVVSVTVYVTDIAFLDRITTFACSTFRRTVRRAHRRDRQARDARAADRDSGRSRPALINRTSRASPFGIYRR